MNKKRNKLSTKAFTLVELLVAITILGIILVIAIPQVMNLQNSNRDTKYKKYAESMISSGKLYTDSHKKDMFGNSSSGCYDITYKELVEQNLLKGIKVDNADCEVYNGSSSLTFVRVLKSQDNYMYDVSIKCVDKDNRNKVLYEDKIPDSVCGGQDIAPPTISLTPNGASWTKGTNLKVTLKVSDQYGMLENVSIKYAWTTTPNSVSESEYKTHDFKNDRFEGTTVSPLKVKMTVPQNVTGTYYLVVKPVNVRDANGNTLYDNFISSAFNFDNTAPICAENNGSTEWTASNRTITVKCTDNNSGCNQSEYSQSYTTGTTVTGSLIISDKVGNQTTCSYNVYVDKTPPTTPTAGAIGTVSGSNTTGSIQTAASGSTDNPGSGVAGYRYLVTNTSTTPAKTAVTNEALTFTRSCNTSYYAWAVAIDNVGNISDVKSLGNTKDGVNAYSNYSACSVTCGGGTQTSTTNSCALITAPSSQACNTHSCYCQETTETYGEWSACDAACGATGTQYRDVFLVDKYDNSYSCGKRATQDTQSCNGDPCPHVHRYGDYYNHISATYKNYYNDTISYDAHWSNCSCGREHYPPAGTTLKRLQCVDCGYRKTTVWCPCAYGPCFESPPATPTPTPTPTPTKTKTPIVKPGIQPTAMLW